MNAADRVPAGMTSEPVKLIVTALAADTALGLRDPVSPVVRVASANLRALVRKRLAGRRDAAMLLARHAEAPQTWQAPLVAELTAAGAAQDAELVAAAAELLRLADEPGVRPGTCAADTQGGSGIQPGV